MTTDIEAALSTLAVLVPLVAVSLGLACWGAIAVGEN